MEIKLISYEKDNEVKFDLDGIEGFELPINNYTLSQRSKRNLESQGYVGWQIEHISEILKEMMLDAEREKNKNGQVEDKTPSLEKEIRAVCDEMAAFLIEKNKAYGNSAADPVGIFAKRLNPLDQIDVRIDDKLNRLQKGHEYPGDDTIVDLAGYLILRMIVAKA